MFYQSKTKQKQISYILKIDQSQTNQHESLIKKFYIWKYHLTP